MRQKLQPRRVAAVVSACMALMAGAAWSAGSPADFITPEFRANHGLGMIGAQYAYAAGYTGRGVVIAVLDSGMQTDHPEFYNRVSGLMRNFTGIGGPGDVADVNASGRIAGHGTHVAGLAGAARDGVGMHGVAYDATLLPIKILGGAASGPLLGMYYAAEQRAGVLNGSFGPPASPEKVLIDPNTGAEMPNPNYRVVDYQILSAQGMNQSYEAAKALAEADVVQVYAAGNEYDVQPLASRIPSGLPMLPLITPQNTRDGILYRFLDSSIPQDRNNPNTWVPLDPNSPAVAGLDFSDLQGTMIAVVAVNRDGKITDYSNRCGAMALWCLAAPGGSLDSTAYPGPDGLLLSTFPYNTYLYMGGTSMASPLVAGSAAVLRQAFPYMSARQIIELLLTSANNSQNDWGNADIYGRGMLDLRRAIGGPVQFGAQGFGAVFDVDTQGYDSVWSNDISGTGGLRKAGAGMLVLQGNNTYTGDTLVAGGLLRVQGSTRLSSTTVQAGGTLGGTGVVGNTVVASGGHVAPGASVGTLTVDGNYTQLTGSVLEVELDPDGQSADRLVVNGTADIQGAQLKVYGLTARALGRDYTFLDAATLTPGSTFQDIDGLTFIDLLPVRAAGGYSLSVRRNAVDFASVAANGNQRAVAGAVQGQGQGGGLFDQVVLLPDAAQGPDVFDQLSGEIHASSLSGMVDASGLVRTTALARMGQAQQQSQRGAWGQILGSWGALGASGDASRLVRSTGGFLVGADRPLGEHAWAGLSAGYTQSSFQGVGYSRLRADGYHLLAYAGMRMDGWSLRGGLAQSWYQSDSRRQIDYQNLGVAHASYGTQATQLFAEGSHAFKYGSTVLEPYAGLAQVWLRAQGFDEDGGAVALHAESARHSVTFSTLGVRGQLELRERANYRVSATGGLGWRHAFGDTAPTTRMALATGQSYTVAGAPLARNALMVELGLEAVSTRGSRIGLYYNGQFAGSTQDHGVQARAVWAF